MASPATVFWRDLDTVERQLRVLADRKASVEAELLHITCEETFLRRQQRSSPQYLRVEARRRCRRCGGRALARRSIRRGAGGPLVLDDTVSQIHPFSVGHPVPMTFLILTR